jgi:hypothetical protein
MVAWLQPANRIWCSLWWDLVAVRFSPSIFEELLEADKLVNWRDLVGLGREARALMSEVQGNQSLSDRVMGLMLADGRMQEAGGLMASGQAAASGLDTDEMMDGMVGALLLEVAARVPSFADEKTLRAALEKGPEPHLMGLQKALARSLAQGVTDRARRAERSLKLVQSMKVATFQ